ncbi:MAG: hypothetical protein CM1200mP2_11040 [Planctomycetaceae bacterium]|nr:MAG: hypothetical protein CM1200mP2_11040 [Planctomycetaceae bacterium]
MDHSRPGNWLLYFSGKHEYNEFPGGRLPGGPGHLGWVTGLSKKRTRHILVRLGPAVTMEVYSGAGGHRVTPDFFAEYEIDWPLFERTRLETKTTMRPSLSSLESFGSATTRPYWSRWTMKNAGA